MKKAEKAEKAEDEKKRPLDWESSTLTTRPLP